MIHFLQTTTATVKRCYPCGTNAEHCEIGANTCEIRQIRIGRELFAETC